MLSGGGGGNRTRVPKTGPIAFYKFSQIFYFAVVALLADKLTLRNPFETSPHH